MELTLDQLHKAALQLNATLPEVEFGKERIRKAKPFKELTYRETAAFLRDFTALSESRSFSERELSNMLAGTCIETASFLFAAGAAAPRWREWCAIGGFLVALAQQPSYAMQLLAIARVPPDDPAFARLQGIRPGNYREQAIQFVIFGGADSVRPTLSPQDDALERCYSELVRAFVQRDAVLASRAVSEAAEVWLEETSYGTFEPGVFPVFEPELNSVVAALVRQKLTLRFDRAKIEMFVQAGLE